MMRVAIVILVLFALAGCQQEIVFPTPLPTATAQPTATAVPTVTPQPTATPDSRISQMSDLRTLVGNLGEDVDDLSKQVETMDDLKRAFCDSRYRMFVLWNGLWWVAEYGYTGDVVELETVTAWIEGSMEQPRLQGFHEGEELPFQLIPLCSWQGNEFELP